MEGEDSEKPDQKKDDDTSPPPEQVDQASKTSSGRGASVQSVPIALSPVKEPSTPFDTKSFLKPPSTTFETKSSVMLRTSVSKSSPSEKNIQSSIKFATNAVDGSEELADVAPKSPAKIGGKSKSVLGISANLSGLGAFPIAFLSKRSPFIHNPPEPEERRERIQHPSTPREYIINLREDLADFQESHGLPRTRDYSFVSLGLALAQETARAVYSVFLMFAELFPILSIVSLILRFALDKLIEILETPEPVVKLKKAIIFGLEMLVIVIPLWILIGTIVLPLMSLIFSIFKRVLRFKGGKKKSPGKSKPKPKIKTETCCLFY